MMKLTTEKVTIFYFNFSSAIFNLSDTVLSYTKCFSVFDIYKDII